MLDREAILEKIAALLKIEGRTPEEAASYVAKANALAEKHGIAIYEVHGRKAKMRSDVQETEATVIFEQGKPQAWRWEVLKAAAQAAGVRVMQGSKWEAPTGKRRSYRRFVTAYFVGLPLDVQVAQYSYEFLVREVERLAKAHARVAWDEIRANAQALGISVHEAERQYVDYEGGWKTHPLKREASFRKGAAYGVGEALRGMSETRQATDDDTLALVVDRDAAIEDYLSIKTYGKTVAEREAESKARWEKIKAAEAVRQANLPAKPAKPFKWTKRDQERLEASERRRLRREQAANNRYWAGVDVGSWTGGRKAGQAMKVRPGIEGGDK